MMPTYGFAVADLVENLCQLSFSRNAIEKTMYNNNKQISRTYVLYIN